VSRFRRHTSALALVVAAVLVLTAAGALGSLGHGKRKHSKSAFTMRGHVSGLYPGARKRLSIVVRNRSRRALRVRSISTRVRPARRGCGARNVRVARFRGRLRVGPHRSRRVSVAIRMLRSAPQACQKATFRLQFRGRAVRAG
jgi:hypothetical protein